MEHDKSVETRRAWIGSISLLCIGTQFSLLAILTFVNMGFVSADLPGRQPIGALSWDQWIALYCYRVTGYPLLLAGLWVIALFAWIKDAQCGRVTVAQRNLISHLLIPAWILFLGLNGALLLHCFHVNRTELLEKSSIYIVGPSGAQRPQVSFLPWLVPLVVFAGLGFSQKFRSSSGWRRQLLANLPIVLLVVVAEFHVNFAPPMCEIINGNPSPVAHPTSTDVIGCVTCGVLITVVIRLVLAQARSQRTIRPLPQPVATAREPR